MNLLSVKLLAGPNVYSYSPVVKVELDIGVYENLSSAQIPGFVPKLLEMMPSLESHKCSRGYEGGFVERLFEGTYMAHIFEHVALELQALAGYDVTFGKTRSAGKPGVYDVVYRYVVPQVGQQSAIMAEQILKQALGLEQEGPSLAGSIDALKNLGRRFAQGPSTRAILEAAKKRDIPITAIDDDCLYRLGYGCRQQWIWASLTSRTHNIAVDISCNKALTKKLLEAQGLPVPAGKVTRTLAEAQAALRELGDLVAVKPLNGNQGQGVTLSVCEAAELERAFAAAKLISDEVLVEKYVQGKQYRLCVVAGKLVAAAERLPAQVVGDGQKTIAQLVEDVNNETERGEEHEKALTKIRLDSVALSLLGKQGYSPQSVVPAGRRVLIRQNANLSTGGTACDVTAQVHPHVALMAERAAATIGLDVAGIDLVAQDIAKPLTGQGAFIEVNAAPGLRMHLKPSKGQPQPVAEAIVNSLFPDSNGRIPIIAVTGTNGKTTVTRLTSYIWQQAGFKVGMTTTDGIYRQNTCLMPGDTTGPASAQVILSDKNVEVAVLETARGGILRGGLGFDWCDVGVVTNITEDHLGQQGIESLEDLAFIKSLVVERVKSSGYALLNADDPYVAQMSQRVHCNIAYFSTKSDNILVRRHLGAGGMAFFVKQGALYAAIGRQSKRLAYIREIPITYGGAASHNVQNALVAAAASYVMKIPVSIIKHSLATFEHNPGRLNIRSYSDFQVCVDYGHNPAGYEAILATARKLKPRRILGIIAAPGDRRNDVIKQLGQIAGHGFHEIWIKEDQDLRGRVEGEVAGLLKAGAINAGLGSDLIHIVLDEKDAVPKALSQAKAGDLVVIFYEDYDKIQEILRDYEQERETKSLLLKSSEADSIRIPLASIQAKTC